MVISGYEYNDYVLRLNMMHSTNGPQNERCIDLFTDNTYVNRLSAIICFYKLKHTSCQCMALIMMLINNLYSGCICMGVVIFEPLKRLLRKGNFCVMIIDNNVALCTCMYVGRTRRP